jgi:hypothetical protein
VTSRRAFIRAALETVRSRLEPLGPKPDIIGPDFRSVAKLIVEGESRQA